MIVIMLPILLLMLPIILVFLSDKIKKSIKLYLLITIDILLFLSILFIHYLENIFSILFMFFIFILFIIYLATTVTFLVKYFNKKYLVNLLVPILCIVILFNDIPEKIAIKIELHKVKNKFEKILKNEPYNTKGVYIENGIYAFEYNKGFKYIWEAIVYDSSGLLENGIELIKNNKNNFGDEEYRKIIGLFGGDLLRIKKLEDNWYLCYFQ